MRDKDSKLIWEAHSESKKLYGVLKDNLYSAGMYTPKNVYVTSAYFPSTESQTPSSLHTLEGWEDIKATYYDSDQSDHLRENIKVFDDVILRKGIILYYVSSESIEQGEHDFGAIDALAPDNLFGTTSNFWTEYEGDEPLDLDDVYQIPKEYIQLNKASQARNTLRRLR